MCHMMNSKALGAYQNHESPDMFGHSHSFSFFDIIQNQYKPNEQKKMTPDFRNHLLKYACFTFSFNIAYRFAPYSI